MPTSSNAPELFDTHCHLSYPYDNKTHTELVAEAAAAGVKTLVTIGTDFESTPDIIKISEAHQNVYYTVGIHPHDSKTLDEPGLIKIMDWSRHPKCRAIGEIGLDYHYDNSPRDQQRWAFDAQLNLALDRGLPVVIHSRDAEDDILSALEKYRVRVPEDRMP